MVSRNYMNKNCVSIVEKHFVSLYKNVDEKGMIVGTLNFSLLEIGKNIPLSNGSVRRVQVLTHPFPSPKASQLPQKHFLTDVLRRLPWHQRSKDI